MSWELRLVARLYAFIIFGLAIGICPGKAAYWSAFTPTEFAVKSKMMFQTQPAAAKARPGHFAELEELEAARKKKPKAEKLAAYDLFLERHPKSRYAPQAKRERAAAAN
jgi:hypothetical protein